MDPIYQQFSDYVASLDDLQNFKSHPSFQYVLEHVSFDQGNEYLLEIFSKTTFEQKDIIEFCQRNDQLGNSTKYDYGFITTSPTNFRYIFHAFLILQHITSLGKKNIKLVEVGCGYGGLCLALDFFSSKFDIVIDTYYMIDLPYITALQEIYLSNYSLSCKVSYHNGLKFGDSIEDHDLFLISNYCFSEISKENQDKYISNLFPKVSHGFMVWNHIPFFDFGFDCRTEIEYPLTGTMNQYVYF